MTAMMATKIKERDKTSKSLPPLGSATLMLQAKITHEKRKSTQQLALERKHESQKGLKTKANYVQEKYVKLNSYVRWRRGDLETVRRHR